MFPEWKRVLKTDGLLMFSCFGPDTLKELRAAAARALPNSRAMPFVDMHDFGDMMVASGFATPVMDAEIITLTYASPQELLREVRALGGNPRDDRAQSLPSGRQARQMLRALEAQRGDDGRIRLTFEVAYGHAWKPMPRKSSRRSRRSRSRRFAPSWRAATGLNEPGNRESRVTGAHSTTEHSMSIISFFKEAGEKLFGKKAQAAQSELQADPAAIDAANREAATAIENYINSMGLTATG